jgi:hypothetical protein
LDTSESGSEVPGKFLNVVLEKDGEEQLYLSRKNGEILHRIKEERNILLTVKQRKAK